MRLLAALALSLFTLVAHAQVALPPGVTRVTSAEGITEYNLANGGPLATMLAGQLELDRRMDYEGGIDAAIEAVTLAQVNAAFRKHLDPAKLVKVYAGDFAKATR